jgi:hypothetical protein
MIIILVRHKLSENMDFIMLVSYISFLRKNEVGLWDHNAVCMYLLFSLWTNLMKSCTDSLPLEANPVSYFLSLMTTLYMIMKILIMIVSWHKYVDRMYGKSESSTTRLISIFGWLLIQWTSLLIIQHLCFLFWSSRFWMWDQRLAILTEVPDFPQSFQANTRIVP